MNTHTHTHRGENRTEFNQGKLRFAVFRPAFWLLGWWKHRERDKKVQRRLVILSLELFQSRLEELEDCLLQGRTPFLWTTDLCFLSDPSRFNPKARASGLERSIVTWAKLHNPEIKYCQPRSLGKVVRSMKSSRKERSVQGIARYETVFALISKLQLIAVITTRNENLKVARLALKFQTKPGEGGLLSRVPLGSERSKLLKPRSYTANRIKREFSPSWRVTFSK